MADAKISQLTPVTGAALQNNDLFVVARPLGAENFSLTREEMFKSVPAVDTAAIRASDGTAAITLADATGVVSITTVAVSGGTIDGTSVGATTASTGAFTTLTASSTATLNTLSSSGATLSGGTINGVTIGATTASTGAFTTLSASTSVTTPLVTNAGTVAISATGANIVTASTNGSERMRITSAGNVGIGTSSPAALLDVQKNGDNIARFGDSFGNNTALIIENVSGTAKIKYAQASDGAGNKTLAFFSGTTERMRIDSAGNVGIGTTAPARALHVSDVMRLQPRATAPGSPAKGDIYFDSSDDKLKCYDGTAWQNLF